MRAIAGHSLGLTGRSRRFRPRAGGRTPLLTSERQCRFTRVLVCRFEGGKKLVSDGGNVITPICSVTARRCGRFTAEVFRMKFTITARCAMLAQQFGISALLNRRFKYLSTGETRCCVGDV
ncbi:hypothetical protein KCP73_03490 [Salmonella enterica subsp. enterica]|nr:hypothetical protein KCP73_03490 [Salmonella enterica subsp. enterica]